MNPTNPGLETLLFEAVEIADASERDAYLRRACGEDGSKLADLQSMVRDYYAAGSIVDRPAAVAPTLAAESPKNISRQIGPYKLRELLGEGGMGSVYVAEQEKPVRRKVALKIIKPGMGSREVISRFESERQALALMDHPNIAKVLDAGTTDTGLPYFVMELVKGLPITEYCDSQRLGTRERLELFIQVCNAIQHAHQKGIIHRDIKPSNVIVAIHDVRPVVKVIDFGVAKAIGQQLTDNTLYTAVSQMVGTPLYMSPEQAGQSSLDIDTRSDVYSLGVLLYELLTGNTPFDKETLKLAGFDEMRRIIREVDPPRPSARVSTLNAEAQSTVAEQRKLEPRQLTNHIRGELDWIVMKAMEKDRSRRYESASGLAADVQNHLNDEPVLASPQSSIYRASKLVRRHRVVILTTTLIGCALVAGTTVSVWQSVKAYKASQLAIEKGLQADRASQLSKEKQRLAESNFNEALEAVDNILRHLTDESFRTLPKVDEIERGIYLDLLAFHRKLTTGNAATLESRTQLGEVCGLLGGAMFNLNEPGEELYLESLSIFRDLHSQSPSDPRIRIGLGMAHCNLAYHGSGSLVERTKHHRMALDVLVPLFDVSPDIQLRDGYLRSIIIYSRLHLASCYRQLRLIDDAEAEVLKAKGISSSKHASLMDSAAQVHQELSEVRLQQDRVTVALEEIDLAIGIREQRFKIAAPYPIHLVRFCNDWSIRGDILRKLERLSEAEMAYVKSFDIAHTTSKEHPAVKSLERKIDGATKKLVTFYRESNRKEDGRKFLAKIPIDTADNLQLLSESYLALGCLEECREAIQAVVELEPNAHGRLNKFAWMISQSVETNASDDQLATELAEKAVQLSPQNWIYWDTLGACTLKNGEWRRAIECFKECNRLLENTSPLHDFYLTICHCKLKENETALEFYKKAVKCMETKNTSEASNRRLAMAMREAKQLLGIAK